MANTGNEQNMPDTSPDGVDASISPGNSRTTERECNVGPDGVDNGDGISWSRNSDSGRNWSSWDVPTGGWFDF